MKTLTINLPDTVDEKDVKMHLAAQLFDKGILSSGQAAELVGISKKEFMPIQFNDTELELFKRIKSAFDPDNLLNPGKIF